MKLMYMLKRITPKWIKEPIKKIITKYNNFDRKYFINNIYRGGGYLELIEFFITSKCNYNCEYCFGDFTPKKLNASDETINNFIKLIPKLQRGACIKLIGGEPTFHPRFIEVANCILENNKSLDIGTNFSLSNDIFKHLIDCSKKENQIKLIVSLHLSQIKSIPEFIEKLISLKNYGKKKIKINVVSVLIEEKIELLKNIKDNLKKYGINMSFQRLKIYQKENKKFSDYTEETEKYLKEAFPNSKTKKIKDFNPYGMLCKAGYSFIRIDTDGSIYRCYEYQKELFNLGNINNEKKLLKKPMPCLSDRCTCLLPVNRGLLIFDKYNYKLADKMKNNY